MYNNIYSYMGIRLYMRHLPEMPLPSISPMLLSERRQTTGYYEWHRHYECAKFFFTAFFFFFIFLQFIFSCASNNAAVCRNAFYQCATVHLTSIDIYIHFIYYIVVDNKICGTVLKTQSVKKTTKKWEQEFLPIANPSYLICIVNILMKKRWACVDGAK